MRKYWDMSKTNNGSSGCGIVINAFDRENWITISKISVPLKASTAVDAEVVGADILTEVLSLILGQQMNVDMI